VPGVFVNVKQWSLLLLCRIEGSQCWTLLTLAFFTSVFFWHPLWLSVVQKRRNFVRHRSTQGWILYFLLNKTFGRFVNFFLFNYVSLWDFWDWKNCPDIPHSILDRKCISVTRIEILYFKRPSITLFSFIDDLLQSRWLLKRHYAIYMPNVTAANDGAMHSSWNLTWKCELNSILILPIKTASTFDYTDLMNHDSLLARDSLF
jgi:hypothetical protein